MASLNDVPGPESQAIGQSSRQRNLQWILCVALGLGTLALYLPALGHDFLAYDDQQYVTENAQVLGGLTGHGLIWAFGMHAGNWHPLTWLSHMLDCQLYGARPWGHHFTNVLLHVASTLLLFLLWRRLTGALWRSALVAALFAWHPLHVESVAWVAERKDVLSALFWMLSLLAYQGYVTRGECRGAGAAQAALSQARSRPKPAVWYLLALLWFTLGLMSKPMVVTLPLVMLLLDFWPLRRWGWPAAAQPEGASVPGPQTGLPRLVLEKVPFLLLAAGACLVTLSAQASAMVSRTGLGISQRLGHALLAYARYLGALLVPRHLAVYYPYEKGLAAAPVVAAGLLLAGLTVVVFRLGRRRPYLLTGWLWFVGTLVPVIGLVQVGDQAWADRYSYLPSIGLFVVAVWGLSDLAGHLRFGGLARGWAAATVGVALLAATSVQLHYWKDTRTLFEQAARVTRNNPLAITLLGSLLEQEGKLDQAMEHYHTALKYSPGFPEAHFFLGHALDQQGQTAAAIAEYRQALWFKPFQEQACVFLGAALAKEGQTDEAATQYRNALKVNSQSAVAHNNLAKLLHAQGRLEEAIVHYRAALASDPGLAQAHNNLGVLLLQQGRLAEGTAQLREAVRLKPADAEAQVNLAQGLVQQGQWQEAADLFAKTVSPGAADPNVHWQYATALAHLHKTREAMSHYASALLLKQDLPPALDGLSWILATDPDSKLRNGEQAYAMAGRACDLTGRNDPDKLKTLAAACAESGRFSEAVFAAQAAQEIATKAGRADLAEQCRLMAERFKESQPWRTER